MVVMVAAVPLVEWTTDELAKALGAAGAATVFGAVRNTASVQTKEAMKTIVRIMEDVSLTTGF